MYNSNPDRSAASESAELRQADDASTSSRCPMPENYRNPAVYNVYGQRINDQKQQSCPSPLSALQGTDLLDPKNNMPLEANQQPCPGQRKPLSVERIQSNIPKGGTDTTWLYPSPQMFYNGKHQRWQQGSSNQQQDTCKCVDSSIAAHAGASLNTYRCGV